MHSGRCLHGHVPHHLPGPVAPQQQGRSCRGRRLAAPAPHSRAVAPCCAASQAGDGPSTSYGLLPQQQPVQPVQQQPVLQGGGSGGGAWNYKYAHAPCASPCSAGDHRCLKLEALFQNVLMYPRLPARVCAWLPAMHTSVEQVTETVEALADRFGAELSFYIIRRQPMVLAIPFETLVERAENVRSMLDLKPAELFGVLRKNPNVLLLEAAEMRDRYNAIHKVVHLNRDAVRTMVRKLPLLLNSRTETLEQKIDNLRHLAYTRVQWQENFDCITPSLLAFFFKDARDLQLRLEYLAVTRAAPDAELKDIFKMTNGGFSRKYPDFRAFRVMQLQKRAQKQQRLERLAQAQAQEGQRLAQAQAQGQEEQRLAQQARAQARAQAGQPRGGQQQGPP